MTMLSTGFGAIVEPRGTQKTRRRGARGALEQARRRFAEGGESLDTSAAAGEAALGGHQDAISAMGGQAGLVDRALDYVNNNPLSVLSAGMPGSGIAGAFISGIGNMNERQVQDAIEKGNFNEKGELIGTGLMGEQVAINSGPGPTGGGFRDNGSLSNDRSGDGPGPEGPGGSSATGGGAGQGAARPSKYWNPQTLSYEDILIQPDGRRTRPDGTPLFANPPPMGRATMADGGSVSGLIYGADGGRADTVEAELPTGGYVIPATEVSARGDGNTLAGALEMARDLGLRMQKLPTVKGGDIPARIAHGELWVAPRDVRKNGGAGALDRYVMQLRQQHINKLRKLPEPA